MATVQPLVDNTKLTLTKLESHLWGAADILRGSIDSSDYKHCLNADIASNPEEHRFDIPQEHSWKEICKHSTDIGRHRSWPIRTRSCGHLFSNSFQFVITVIGSGAASVSTVMMMNFWPFGIAAQR